MKPSFNQPNHQLNTPDISLAPSPKCNQKQKTEDEAESEDDAIEERFTKVGRGGAAGASSSDGEEDDDDSGFSSEDDDGDSNVSDSDGVRGGKVRVICLSPSALVPGVLRA